MCLVAGLELKVVEPAAPSVRTEIMPTTKGTRDTSKTVSLGRIPALFDIPFEVVIEPLGDDGEFWESSQSSCGCTATDFSPQFVSAAQPLRVDCSFTAQANSSGPQSQTLSFKSNLRTFTVHVSADVLRHDIKQLPELSIDSTSTITPPITNMDPGQVFTVFISESLRRRGVSLNQRNQLQLCKMMSDYFPLPRYPQMVGGNIALVLPQEETAHPAVLILPVIVKTNGLIKSESSLIEFGFVGGATSAKKTLLICGPEEVLATLSLEHPDYIKAEVTAAEECKREIAVSLEKREPEAGFHRAELVINTFAEAYVIHISFAE